jgi:hypothetical protein
MKEAHRKELMIQSWVFAQGYKIYCYPVSGKKLGIEIEKDGKIKRGTRVYKNAQEASDAIWKIYKYLWEEDQKSINMSRRQMVEKTMAEKKAKLTKTNSQPEQLRLL